jgi:hypothetical protein
MHMRAYCKHVECWRSCGLTKGQLPCQKLKGIYLHSTQESSVNKVQRFYVRTAVIVAKEFDITSKNYAILKSEFS